MITLSSATITELQAESSRLQSLMAQLETNLADARASLGSVRAELEKRLRPAPEPRISDHAILRFLERAMGIDVASIKKRLLSDDVREAIKAGASAVIVDGVRLKVQDNTIVTVMDNSPRPPKRLLDRAREPDDGPSIEDGLLEYYEEKGLTP